MPPRLYRDSHRACIIDEPTVGKFYTTSNLPAAITNPKANLKQVYFHSDLDYLIIAYDRSMKLTLPARNYPPGTAYHYFPSHNLGFLPFGVLVVGNSMIPTGEPIQGSSSAARHAALGVDTTRIWLRECWNYSSLPAITMTFRAILFKPAPVGAVSHMAYEGPDFVAYGRGKFDTRNNYLKSSPSSPDFWMTRGRTIDTTYGGYRGVRPNGTRRQFNSYTGSFTGSGFFGVAD